jgi:outer membrane lipoprotein-sorting protein
MKSGLLSRASAGGGEVAAADSANVIPAIDQLTPAEIIQKAAAKYASLDSYSDDGATVSTIGGQTLIQTFNIKLARSNLYRIDWRQDMGSFVSTGIVWSAGNGHFLKSEAVDQKYPDPESALGSARGLSSRASATIPGTFFKMNWGNELGAATRTAKRQADQRVGGVDCYVLAYSASAGRTSTLWIGRKDGMIHQVRNVISAAATKAALNSAAERMSTPPTLPASLDTVTMTETHSNIVVNAALTPADFNP